MNRELLVEGGQTVHVTDTLGNVKFFTSILEFETYSGIDMSDKSYIDYEPDKGVHIDDTLDTPTIPYAPYDTVISNISDPYYGLTGQEQKDLAYSVQVAAIETRKRAENEKPFPYDGQTYKSDASAKNDVEGVLGQCALYLGTDYIPTFPINASLAGCWITEENIPVQYTCDEFKVFAKTYFDRFSWNFDNRVTHQLTLKAIYDDPATVLQDVLNYDLSGGWK